MVSYYDIRAAQKAARALHGRLLRGRKLDIRYSIPKVLFTLLIPLVCMLCALYLSLLLSCLLLFSVISGKS